MSAQERLGELGQHAATTASRLTGWLRGEAPRPDRGSPGRTALAALARSTSAIGAAAPEAIPDAVISAVSSVGCDRAWFVVPRLGGVVVGAASGSLDQTDLEEVLDPGLLADWLSDRAAPDHDLPADVAWVPVVVGDHHVAAIVATWQPSGGPDPIQPTALRIIAAHAATALANADRVRSAQEVVERLHEVERLRHDLISTAAHELRTPTTVIRGATELLDHRWEALEEGQRRDLVGRVAHHAVALEHVLDQLASYVEFSAGTGRPLDRTPVDLGALVEHVLEAEAETLREHQVICSSASLELLADRAVLTRAIRELLRNAATHTPAGTQVRVQVERGPHQVRLVVSDDGPGVPETALATLIDPLTRSGDVLTRATRGIGLGLNFVDHAARTHGGHLDLTSDGGFTATIHLPAAAERLVGPAAEQVHADTPTDAPTGTPAGTNRPHVLVVEDDVSLQRLAEVTLTDAGCSVMAVGDGRRAVRAAAARRPDVVVLDVDLPGLDGREVARLLRDEASTADVPIVVVTGSADRRELWSIWTSGADALLVKPYDVVELADTVLGLAERPAISDAPDRRGTA